MILVTGGAGFIGSNLVQYLIGAGETVLNLDKLTYAGNPQNLLSVLGKNHIFVHGDIGNQELVSHLLTQHRPHAVINLAAETHVDRSIRSPHANLTMRAVTSAMSRAQVGAPN
jgi:dTDP-glucose 4,6-dehydratase